MRPARRPPELLTAPFTVEQARAVGLTAKQLRGSAWRKVIHGVYAAADLPDSLELRCSSVKLVLPTGAAVGYTAAAWLHGADVRRSDSVEVIAQRGDQIRRRGLSASSALLEDDDIVVLFGVHVTTPTRTAFDLARQPDVVESVVGVDAMLNRGGCSAEELTAYVAAHRGWWGVRYADRALAHAEPKSESPMETRQRMHLVLSGLPRPKAQVPVFDESGVPFARIDNGYEKWKVGADYDGGVHAEKWRYDLERQEGIRDRGWWHRRYTSLHITRAWRQMVDQVGRALVDAGWRPAPSA